MREFSFRPSVSDHNRGIGDRDDVLRGCGRDNRRGIRRRLRRLDVAVDRDRRTLQGRDPLGKPYRVILRGGDLRLNVRGARSRTVVTPIDGMERTAAVIEGRGLRVNDHRRARKHRHRQSDKVLVHLAPPFPDSFPIM